MRLDFGCCRGNRACGRDKGAMRTDEVCGRPLDSFALPSGCGLGFGENFYVAVLFGILYAALFRIPHSDFRIPNCFFTLLVLK